jgi:hypothetical protein
MPNSHISNILQIMKTRWQHCRSLLTLSKQQRELIETDDYTQLLTVLGKKQRILGRLDELTSRHPNFGRQWQTHRDSLDSKIRKEGECVLSEIEAILSELLELEKESTNVLSHRRDETKRQLETLSQGTQTHAAYRDSLAPVTSRHLDTDR